MLFTLLGFIGLKGLNYAVNTQLGRENTNEWGVYQDDNGNLRLCKNGKKVVDTYDNNGDIIIKYVSNGRPIVNITKEEANAREQMAIKQGKKFYLRQSDNGFRSKLGSEEIRGERYCKVGKPHTYYVKRFVIFNCNDKIKYAGEFYMDMKCHLICPTEEQIDRDTAILKNYPKLYKVIIKEWSSYITSPYTNVKYNSCITIGDTNKNNYKTYSNKISRWNGGI